VNDEGWASLASLGSAIRNEGYVFPGKLKSYLRTFDWLELGIVGGSKWYVRLCDGSDTEQSSSPAVSPAISPLVMMSTNPFAGRLAPAETSPGTTLGAPICSAPFIVAPVEYPAFSNGTFASRSPIKFVELLRQMSVPSSESAATLPGSFASSPLRPTKARHLIVGRAPATRGHFGTLPKSPGYASPVDGDYVSLNTSLPFCLLTVGLQGAGKSHSLAVTMENCLAHTPPVPTIIFHFDKDETNVCEAATVAFSKNANRSLVVFVSPSYFKQRKAYYSGTPSCTVLPLVFRWRTLTASFLRSLMRISVDDKMPLYMTGLLEELRSFQKADRKMSYAEFRAKLEEDSGKLLSSQSSPLAQRLALLDAFVAESEQNSELLAIVDQCNGDVETILANQAEPCLVVFDLTDPLRTGEEANGIFQVVLGMFQRIPAERLKLVVFDEAHKYLNQNGDDELSKTITEIAREMRHNGTALAVSTQSPRTLPSELLELASIVLMHRFSSPDWFNVLKQRLPIQDTDFPRIQNLDTGQALAFSLYWALEQGTITHNVHLIQVRPRYTIDAGKTRTFT